jgi:hypothetical protein
VRGIRPVHDLVREHHRQPRPHLPQAARGHGLTQVLSLGQLSLLPPLSFLSIKMVHYIMYGTNIFMVPPLSLSFLPYLDCNFAVSLPLSAQSDACWRIKRNFVELRNRVQRVNRMAEKTGNKISCNCLFSHHYEIFTI